MIYLIPSLTGTPLMTSARCFDPSSFRHFPLALKISLKAMAKTVLRLRQPMVFSVQWRTFRTKGCLSKNTALAMVFKLCRTAQKKWRKLDGSNQLAEIICGVKFVNGQPQERAAA